MEKLEALLLQRTVQPQVNAPHSKEGRALVAELVDARHGTCEHPCFCVVMVLTIVDDLTKNNEFLAGVIGVAQTDREGRELLGSVAVGTGVSGGTSHAFRTWG